MKTLTILACAVAALCFGGRAYAIDGGAAVVDTLGVDATSFNQVGSYAITLESEVGAIIPTEDWAVLAGVSYRSVDPDWSESTFEGLGGELGIKYYFTRLSSLALLGNYQEYDCDASKKVTATGLRFDQRFMPARSGVSPFIKAGFWMRFPNYELADPVENRDKDYMIDLGFGSDFMITDTLAMTFRGTYRSILGTLGDIKDFTKNDGWIGTVGFVGYWD